MAEIHREYDRGMTDEYRDALKNLIEQKIEHGDKAASSSLAERLADRVLHVLRRGRGHQMNAGTAVAR
jgi:non-homologous end joining protein Ku